MYDSTSTLAGTAQGPAMAQGIGSQERQSTQLDAHLNFLRSLHEELGGAANRAMQLADRLLGQEPANITKAPPSKEANVLPMLARLERAGMEAKELVTAIHYHLNRLERL